MYRTHNCGELNINSINEQVELSGWVQRIRTLGGMNFVDLRDRYGITQLAFDQEKNAHLKNDLKVLGREFVIQVKGKVIERSSKNKNIPTGEIEIEVEEFHILNASKTPPFTIENNTDGGEELRMKYRYLDLRREPLKNNLILRNRLNLLIRNFLSEQGFLDIETPYLIKSTPEGARDFVVPSRMNAEQFYALPQSPQTFKQLLMIAGYDKYYQIVKCFRDEDLRADRQPEFTQIDCEMSFVEREDILSVFEGLLLHLLKTVKNVEIDSIPRISYDESMRLYGNDKPDIRFGMQFVDITEETQNKGFKVFDESEAVLSINVEGAASYSRKQLDALTDYVRRPQIGAKGMVYIKNNEDGTIKSSVDKFYTNDDLKVCLDKADSKPGDLMLVLSGPLNSTRKALSELRLYLAEELGLRNPEEFAPVWVLDFPLLEWDEESNRFHAMHHPFTSPRPEDLDLLNTDPGKVKANAYDLVLNGNEIGGGSIRIHDKELQAKMFEVLGFTDEEAKAQFGFLMNAFEYGAPPHGGIAFGFDRLSAILGGQESIRDFMAFPKNNSGRDLMIDAPSPLDPAQLDELSLKLKS